MVQIFTIQRPADGQPCAYCEASGDHAPKDDLIRCDACNLTCCPAHSFDVVLAVRDPGRVLECLCQSCAYDRVRIPDFYPLTVEYALREGGQYYTKETPTDG